MKQFLRLLIPLVVPLFLFTGAQAQWTEKWKSVDVGSIAIQAFANIDDDPGLEIIGYGPSWVEPPGGYPLCAYDATTGLIEYQSSKVWEVLGKFWVLDVDGDGKDEVVFFGREPGDDIGGEYCYEVGTGDGVTDSGSDGLILESKLHQNYPNPFNPNTTIEYCVQDPAKVTISVYNVLGQKVKTLVDEEKLRGDYTINWDGKNDAGNQVASGVYFYQVKVGDYTSSKKMLLLK
ncbi:MAG: FlgD immunoglobulin-like domain containing protein [Candidatus Zixiibacteriota bacterium]